MHIKFTIFSLEISTDSEDEESILTTQAEKTPYQTVGFTVPDGDDRSRSA